MIRSLIAEAANGLHNIPQDYYVRIINKGRAVKIELVSDNEPAPVGGIMMRGPLDDCAGSYVIAGTSAKKGWGPFLYDIAIEWATMYGDGLAPDRSLVSPEARSLWDFYLKNRADVEKSQLDDLNDTLTATPDDNCDQESASDDAGDKGFASSSLSKRYTKEPTTITALKKLGKIKIN